ncbi:23S rRNA (pseudouridine(1915)-N(3))-methyltransferase RlmH [Candidatus Woesearchaeota archaeon]|nr:23S rRNA (pseudouridine(1915)-N(3))-methyltransferase RlmH [Candidatus Woesearchaeota archaeon]
MIRLVFVGKTKEYRKEIDEYMKRMSALARAEVVEVKEEKITNYSEKVKTAEGERALRAAGDRYIVGLDERGKQMTSDELAKFLKDKDDVAFVVGGALGLSKEVISKSDTVLSLSKMTLTHQMARLVLVEQVYRAHMIMKGRKYHK